jgi:flagellar basal-body rod protein FlgF
MDQTLLVSLSHQLAAYRSMDAIANNIANVGTPGYKRETAMFDEYVETVPPTEGQDGPQKFSFVQDAGLARDLQQGEVDKTNAPFDLAVNGKGYFVVKRADGSTHYTRNGHFTLDPQGRVATESGDLLQGDGGEIAITSDDGDIHIGQDGTITGAKGQLGKVQLVNFANERALTKEGASLYTTTQQPQTVAQPNIAQGALENSNVQPVVEISSMLEVMRAYQATASLNQSQEDMMRQAIDKLGTIES